MQHGEDLGTRLRVPRIRRGALEYYVDTDTLKHSEIYCMEQQDRGGGETKQDLQEWINQKFIKIKSP